MTRKEVIRVASIEPSLDDINMRIARAYLRNRYPLSEEGQEFQREVESLVASGRIPRRFAKRLPTVEHPRFDELFTDFELTPEQEAEVFGWELTTIQSHYGCTHQCKQCYKDAPCRLSMMPFVAIGKIAAKKLEYEKRGTREWRAWEEHLTKLGIIDLKSYPMKEFLDSASKSELLGFLVRILEEWGRFSPVILKMRVPLNKRLPVDILRKECLQMVPINLGAVINAVFNYEGNDPLEYRDYLFPHQNGAPADYGDVFSLMTTNIRPIIITTAGWFPEDKVACRAMRKVIDACIKEPLINSEDNRISISFGERHARQDLKRYFDEIKAMVQEMAPIKPMISLYYEEENLRQKYIAFRLGEIYDKMLNEEFGIEKDKVMVTPISYLRGRAINMRKGEVWADWDPDGCADGIHIYPNGEVGKKPSFSWAKRRDKQGKLQHFISTPKGSDPEPTGIWLYHLNEQKQ